jgi:hypothetical protein
MHTPELNVFPILFPRKGISPVIPAAESKAMKLIKSPLAITFEHYSQVSSISLS